MTADELERLLIAPELIVLDIAAAVCVALRRALLLQHPMVIGEPRTDQPPIRRRAVALLRHLDRLECALAAYRATADQVIADYRANIRTYNDVDF